jgi:glycosyltransferase involved in cell wall biosynthesis
MNPRVSIIIPAYNDAKTLEKIIPSILNQKYDGDVEILLVDDSSTDNTLEVARKYDLKIIHHTKNMGLANSVNDGVRNAKYDLICVIHDDILLPDENWLSTMVSHLILDDSIAAITAPSIIPDAIWNNFGFWEKAMFAWEYKQRLSERVQDAEYFNGKNDIFLRDIFMNFGGFDSKTYRVACEDVDLSIRLKRAGYKILCAPLSTCHLHSSHSTGIRKILNKTMVISEGQGVLFRKYRWLGGWNNNIIRSIFVVCLFVPFNPIRIVGAAYILLVTFAYCALTFRKLSDLRVLTLLPFVKLFEYFLKVFSFWKGFVTAKQSL